MGEENQTGKWTLEQQVGKRELRALTDGLRLGRDTALLSENHGGLCIQVTDAVKVKDGSRSEVKYIHRKWKSRTVYVLFS